MFGPEYPKINTVFMRDTRGVILPDEWSCPEFEYLSDKAWSWTEKVDGTNIRLHWDGKNVTVGGRTDDAQVPARLIANLTASGILDTAAWKEVFPDADDVTVYGEGYGGKIQKAGPSYGPDEDIIVFDVRVGRWWLNDINCDDIATKLGLTTVPVVESMPLSYAIDYVRHSHLYSWWDGVQKEGLVGRPAVDLFNRAGERIITKIKVKDWRDYERRK